nr:neurofilament heavy polypeptide-like isoform X2 [Parasteatoda tepidariorum]
MSDSSTTLQEKETSENIEDNSAAVSVKEKGVKRKNEGDSDILNFNPDYSKRLCVEVSSLAFDNEVEIRTSDEVESPTCPKQQAKLPSPTKQQANPLSPTKQQTNPLSPTKQQTKPTSSTKQQTKSPSPTEQHAKPMSPTKQSIKLPTIEQQAPPPQSKEQPYNFRSCKTTENKNFASLDPQDHNATENQPHVLRSHKVLEKEKSAIDCMSHEPQSKKNHNVTANQPHILRSHKILEKEKSAIHCMSPVPQSQKSNFKYFFYFILKNQNI